MIESPPYLQAMSRLTSSHRRNFIRRALKKPQVRPSQANATVLSPAPRESGVVYICHDGRELALRSGNICSNRATPCQDSFDERHTPPLRQWKLLKALSVRRHGMTVREMSEEAGVGFDLQSHFSDSFGVYEGQGDVCVKVHFGKPVARFVQESRWHSSQHLTPQKDGSLIGEFRLSGTEEIKSWLLSFGKHAVVLEPEALRAEVIVELNTMIEQYLPDRRPAKLQPRSTTSGSTHHSPKHRPR